MQAALKGQIGALAFGVALEKAQSGAPPMSKAEFDGLCEAVLTELERAVDAVLKGTTAQPPAKPKKATRAAPAATSGGKRNSGIDPEALRAYIGKSREGAATLGQIAAQFVVSKGVAERAVKSLPGVKSGPGAKPEGQRGVPPTVYWVE